MTDGLPWTETDDALLRKLWAAGLSASIISAQIPGRTRNAVIGRVHRLGLPPRRTAPSPRGYVRRNVIRTEKRTARLAKPKPFKKPTEVRKVETPLPEPVSLRVSLMDLTDSQCRFIADEPREATFCGHQVKDASSFCPHHHARVWVKHNARESVPFRKPIVSTVTGLAA